MTDDPSNELFRLFMRQLDLAEIAIRTWPQSADGGIQSEFHHRLMQVLNIEQLRVTASSINLQSAQEVTVEGDSFSHIGSGATIVNRSTLTNSLNSVKESAGEDVAAALAELADLVEKSGNADATDNFNALSAELERPEPKKSLLKSFWNGITSALGPITQLVEIGDKLSKVFV
ncbi:hypothetical protein FHX75_111310 [Micromonospora palomenae]|uniref:AbiTii domain-containing protein n=1 Tax=Micromonospora palomenae TaxID=1461247 RepID=A0A561WWE3_9ACTN|nr:hypothetical protein [Micromonospora palomenae]TWG28159.1 hypothetical protein FHX75_111310 [Micromonospora palomenae]